MWAPRYSSCRALGSALRAARGRALIRPSMERRHHAHECALSVSGSAEAETGSGTCPIQPPLRSGGFQDTELHERGDPVVESDFLRDLAVLDTQYGRTREVHLPTGCRR